MLRERSQLQMLRSVIVERVLKSSDRASVKLIQRTVKEGFTTIESGRYEVDSESIICLSTQIGCAMACQFCKSTKPFEFVPDKPQRILRSLNAQEIVDQALNALDEVPAPQESKGVVFSYMGMGEPFANLREVKKSILILGTENNRARASISTIGFNLRGIKDLADEVANNTYPIPVKLHISLHGSSDEKRKQVIPYSLPITDTLDVAEKYAITTRTEVKLNYVLISGVNDTWEDACRLGILLKGRRGLILKLAELNDSDSLLVVPSERVNQFENWLKEQRIKTVSFVSQGKDIKAGCGQLVKGGVIKSKNY